MPSPSPSVVVVKAIPIELHRPFASGVSTILYTLEGKQVFVAKAKLMTLEVAGVRLLGKGSLDIVFAPETRAALRKLGGG